MEYRAAYENWMRNVRVPYLLEELQSMDEKATEDAFYRNLAFGTGGLRGILGAGTNRMNVYTVAKASQGVAAYVRRCFSSPSIAIAYDSRRRSEEFARVAADVFAANGIKVWFYSELMPTPCLSYAVRKLGCSAGIVVTASHNPANYNGYKVYDADGCQITTGMASDILKEIEALDIFQDVKRMDFDQALGNRQICYIPENIYEDFLREVQKQSVLYGDPVSQDIAIVYSPLNGTGWKPVTQVLRASGFANIAVVPEQEQPDGDFPTCPYPNPEDAEAMKLGLKYCREIGAKLLLATDPDCDRCGIAVRDGEDYRLLTGNEMGILLLDFICFQRKKHGKMPAHPVFVKTIVTTDLAEKIAERNGVETINVLTGFKFIGEVISRLEKDGRGGDYLCGFEESCGYLTGIHVRDKDGVNAAHMIVEMAACYKERGCSLAKRLQEIYEEYGSCLDTLHSYKFSGNEGAQKMQEIMGSFREGMEEIGGEKVERILDYSQGLDGLPRSNVLKYIMASGSVTVRPSGTEPKLKLYVSVSGKDEEACRQKEKKILSTMEDHMFKCQSVVCSS